MIIVFEYALVLAVPLVLWLAILGWIEFHDGGRG
jgi:hypothetical protein